MALYIPSAVLGPSGRAKRREGGVEGRRGGGGGLLLKLLSRRVVPEEVMAGTEIPGDGGTERLYPTLHCHHQNDSRIKMGSDERHFNVLLIVRDKVTRQCPQTTAFEERGERKRNRTAILPLPGTETPDTRPAASDCHLKEDERDRQTDRQTDRDKQTETDRQTQTDSQRQGHRDREK